MLGALKVFADGANLTDMRRVHEQGLVQGFTTNPTLMRKAGVIDYQAFAQEVLRSFPEVPVSLEVFADDLPTMERQALKLHSWGPQVWVKVPISNTQGVSCAPLIARLVGHGVKVNVTAVTTFEQVDTVANGLSPAVPAIVSVFCGRIADTGRDPLPIVARSLERLSECRAEVLWASPRQIWNVYQAARAGCHIVTVTPELLAKLCLQGRSLDQVASELRSQQLQEMERSCYEL